MCFMFLNTILIILQIQKTYNFYDFNENYQNVELAEVKKRACLIWLMFFIYIPEYLPVYLRPDKALSNSVTHFLE